MHVAIRAKSRRRNRPRHVHRLLCLWLLCLKLDLSQVPFVAAAAAAFHCTKPCVKTACCSSRSSTTSRKPQHWNIQAPISFLAATITEFSNIDETDGVGIGIDLGTTNSAVAYLDDQTGLPHMLHIPHNGRTMPSVVALVVPDGSAIVGRQAQELATLHQVQPYLHTKRVVGTGGRLPPAIVQGVPHVVVNQHGKTYKKYTLTNQEYDANHHPTMLRRHVCSTPAITNDSAMADDDPVDNDNVHDDGDLVDPVEISIHIVRHLVHVAAQHLQRPVTRAVLGIPAYFHDGQRAATLRAAQGAGLAKVKLLREPEAAALAYGRIRKNEPKTAATRKSRDELVLVFDLGGGTYDVSMLMVGDDGLTEIVSTAGDAQLGGANFDVKVYDWLVQQLSSSGDSVATWSQASCSKLLQVAEAVRVHLSQHRVAHLAIPSTQAGIEALKACRDIILPDPSSLETSNDEHKENSTVVYTSLSRRTMESLFQHELQRLLRPIREVAIMAGALLPGDTRPALVEAAMESEEAEASAVLDFDDFYDETTGDDDVLPSSVDAEPDLVLSDIRSTKRQQQRGRKKARNLAKSEHRYRAEKRKLGSPFAASTATSHGGGSASSASSTRVFDGIAGRPIARVVLVGGATRMPVVGRLIAALTGVVPQKTVHPDEAVALGCAVHVGVLDGTPQAGTVLNPMQAAILRAVAEQQQRVDGGSNGVDNLEHDEEF